MATTQRGTVGLGCGGLGYGIGPYLACSVEPRFSYGSAGFYQPNFQSREIFDFFLILTVDC